MKNKRGQITIFIIIAIVLVAGVAVFFVFRDSLGFTKIPANIEPAYNSFLTCLEDEASIGVEVLGSQGGYIELPDFEPGSVYMPFSSQLNFMGSPIPYWYYVSSNGGEEEQVPSQTEMERQLQIFVEERIKNCNLERYYEEGFEIEFGEPEAKVDISNKRVEVRLTMQVEMRKNEDSALIKTHKISVDSKLGKLYNSAKKIYEKEQKNLFLENYAVDTLRLYAPVDGVEITCSPLIWDTNEIFDSLEEAIEVNTFALRTDEDFLTQEQEYFVVDVDVDEEVRFITSNTWPHSFEVLPSDGNVLLANPVGNQPGLGALGFCYVPYHFVYNVNYPVLVQVSSGEELFQFPFAVVIQGNKPRESLNAAASTVDIELCKYKNTPVSVKVYDAFMNPIEAEISYKCFGEKCNMGTTDEGVLNTEFPQCVNGYVIARAEGFNNKKQILSTTNAGSVSLMMDKLYETDINLKLDGSNYDKEAIIYFISADETKTVVYPEQNSVELVEGQYEVQVYIFDNSEIKLPETNYEECVEASRSGIGGLFGMTEQNCFDVSIPAQVISNALIGGGKQEQYILESELQESNSIEILAESLTAPKTLDDLQNNYLLFEDKKLDIYFT